MGEQLAFDFPLPTLTQREFLDLKYRVKNAENDWRTDVVENDKPQWLINLKAQYRAVCGARGHSPGIPWDNGIGCRFVDCNRCGTRISTQYY